MNGFGTCTIKYYKKKLEIYKNGKKDGLSISYYKNGQLSVKTNYDNGEEDGLSISYHENGQLWKKETYKDDKLIKTEKF